MKHLSKSLHYKLQVLDVMTISFISFLVFFRKGNISIFPACLLLQLLLMIVLVKQHQSILFVHHVLGESKYSMHYSYLKLHGQTVIVFMFILLLLYWLLSPLMSVQLVLQFIFLNMNLFVINNLVFPRILWRIL